jgi:uncharacterized membrane protein
MESPSHWSVSVYVYIAISSVCSCILAQFLGFSLILRQKEIVAGGGYGDGSARDLNNLFIHSSLTTFYLVYSLNKIFNYFIK